MSPIFFRSMAFIAGISSLRLLDKWVNNIINEILPHHKNIMIDWFMIIFKALSTIAPMNIPHNGLLSINVRIAIVIPALIAGIGMVIKVIPDATATPFPPLNFR